MLQELKVSQFAIIDSLHIEFQNGLNILSGETGSGKSVLLKSLGLLMGEKASADIIRTGSQQAVVEGSFNLKKRTDIKRKLIDAGIDCDDNQLIVRRVIATGDKSKVYLNGSLSTVNQLREMVAPMIEVTGPNAPLIEMTGQHDNRNLLSKSYHLDLLDQYAGHWDKRKSFEEKFQSLQALRTEIADFEKQSQNKSQRLDFLKFQYQEIKNLNLDPANDMTLEDDIKQMKSSHRILQFVDQCENLVYSDEDSISTRLKLIQKKAMELSTLAPQIAEKTNKLSEAQAILDDLIYELRQDLKKINLDADSLEEKENRLSVIRKLQKKYGTDLEMILQEFDRMKKEISDLENSDEHLEKLKKSAAQLELDLKHKAEDLHSARSKSAIKLVNDVNKELLDLNMKGVTFDIQNSKLDHLNSTGLSDVEYLCQISAKDVKRPIAKVASGGELSRILLSLKKCVGQSDFPRTYLFDEVDTGVSGTTAEKVGRKLKSIAKGQQVICVTHLPQVAACGDVHYSINKSMKKDSISMDVIELKTKTRVEEIARLISGEKITKTSLAHAEQLLSESH
ncbi:MAG: DNA repair protein RecN [Bdellovibrionales bacterium RIFCSPHIGHO2_01_FULL_40_29]|nr:MAG: DNA repair protein RecN [Bdellovibrionales bacterium RIFCSPHIGHO2_01_FULL_40_29]OFZ34004.1 MAG: DNA repair protein RecN [Bdellovibrionales bacterium RIFCSPHIGHO2_02_FULL_40_15]